MGCLRKYKSDKSLKTNDIGKKSIPLEDISYICLQIFSF